jgi:mannan endo-1,4-beta-mannosidase
VKVAIGKIIAALVPLVLFGFLGMQLTLHSAADRARGYSGSGIQAARALRAGSGRQILGRSCLVTCRYAGVALAVGSALAGFVSATGIRPGIVVTYQRFGDPFPAQWSESLAASQVLPLIQINPRKVSLADIAAGRYDHYLARYGSAIREYARPVAISFAHEANGPWYTWGCGHVPSSVYIAAWRRIVTRIRAAGGTNAIWVWTVDVQGAGDCPLASRYPGSRYVDWVGVDGYLRTRRSTFARNFGGTLEQITRFSSRPILLTEVGVPASPGQPARILDLYRSAAADQRIIGVVYFDASTRKGDFRPQSHPAALAAFRAGLRILLGLAPGAGQPSRSAPSP